MVTESVREYSSAEIENIIVNTLYIFKERGEPILMPRKIADATGLSLDAVRQSAKDLASKDKVSSKFDDAGVPGKALQDGVDISEHPLPSDFNFQGKFKDILEGKESKVTVSQSNEAKEQAPETTGSKTVAYANPILAAIRKLISDTVYEGNPTSTESFVYPEMFASVIKGLSKDQVEKGLSTLAQKGYVTEDRSLEDDLFGVMFQLPERDSDGIKTLLSIPESEFGSFFNIDASEVAPAQSPEKEIKSVDIAPVKEVVATQPEVSQVSEASETLTSSVGVSKERLSFASAVMSLSTVQLKEMSKADKRELLPYFLGIWMIEKGGEAYNKKLLFTMIGERVSTSQPTLNKAIAAACNMGIVNEIEVGKRSKYTPVPMSEMPISEVAIQALKDAYVDFDVNAELASKILAYEGELEVGEKAEDSISTTETASMPVVEEHVSVDVTASSQISTSEATEDKKIAPRSSSNSEENVGSMSVLSELDDLMGMIKQSNASESSIDASDIISAIAKIQESVSEITKENQMWRESFEGLVGSVKGHFSK